MKGALSKVYETVSKRESDDPKFFVAAQDRNNNTYGEISFKAELYSCGYYASDFCC